MVYNLWDYGIMPTIFGKGLYQATSYSLHLWLLLWLTNYDYDIQIQFQYEKKRNHGGCRGWNLHSWDMLGPLVPVGVKKMDAGTWNLDQWNQWMGPVEKIEDLRTKKNDLT